MSAAPWRVRAGAGGVSDGVWVRARRGLARVSRPLERVNRTVGACGLIPGACKITPGTCKSSPGACQAGEKCGFSGKRGVPRVVCTTLSTPACALSLIE